jgi:hypothetical protein
VSLELPDSRLAGEVVDEQRDHVAGAMVLAFDASEGSLAQAVTDRAGRFELRGLPPGTAHVGATDPASGAASDNLAVDIPREGSAADVLLSLQRRLTLAAQLVAGAGPVAGAEVTALALGAGGTPASLLTPHGTSDLEGEVTLVVSASTQQLLLTIKPPGLPFQTARLLAPFDSVRPIYLEEWSGDLILHTNESSLSELDPQQILLFREGVPFGLGDLLQWASLKGRPTGMAGDVVVPAVAPGEYMACRVASAAGLLPILAGDAFPRQACTRGYLSPLGQLALALPAGE